MRKIAWVSIGDTDGTIKCRGKKLCTQITPKLKGSGSVVVGLHERVLEPRYLLCANDAIGGRGCQFRPVDTRVLGLARIEHGSLLRRVPDEGGERGVGVAEGCLPEDFDTVI